MPHRFPPSLASATILIVCGAVHAQNSAPIDPGYADVGPLQTSLRALPEVMRHDTAFEHVYQSPVDPSKRYRMAGGVYAVFNNSDYVATRNGVVSLYPADVQFHIGPPPGYDGSMIDPATAALLRYNDPLSRQRADLTAMDRRREEPDRTPVRTGYVAPLTPDPTISNETVRQRRLREMTARALGEAASGGSTKN